MTDERCVFAFGTPALEPPFEQIPLRVIGKSESAQMKRV
jgi:hypothetical protein